MKQCPECGRDYDNSMMFCLDDGAELLYGPASGDEPATAILHETSSPGNAPTRAQMHTTGQTELISSPDTASGQRWRLDKRLLLLPLVGALLVAGFFAYRSYDSQGGHIRSVAVLPFENIGQNADQEYLSDGLAESLIYRLSQIPELKVSPRSSVFRYKGQQADAEKVGAELGVDAVMSGRMVQRGDNLTISVDLVDVRNRKTLWGEQFERKMSDLLATQREIASAIAEKLQVKLTGENATGLTKRYTNDNEAYQAYLKGRYYWNRRTAENLKKAIEQFKIATDRDPNFALAYVGLADCYAVSHEYAGTPTSETIPPAKSYAERALAIDDQLAEPHATLGSVHNMLWEYADSEREYKRAIELNPNYATAYHWYSIFLKDVGRYDEAASVIKRAQELDPLSSVIAVNISRLYQLQNNHEASIQNSLKIIELDPNFAPAHEFLALSYSRQGRNAEAIAEAEKAAELSNRSGVALGDMGYVYALAGKRAEALAVIKELEDKYARREAIGQFIAGVYVGLGAKEKAYEWLEKDFAVRNGKLPEVRWQLPFESIRDEPQFKDILRRMGMPEMGS
jgi:TolB-like protein/Flp pilus assembly protein TadD